MIIPSYANAPNSIGYKTMTTRHQQVFVPIFSGVLLLLIVLTALQPADSAVPIARERTSSPLIASNVPLQTAAAPLIATVAPTARPATPTRKPPPTVAPLTEAARSTCPVTSANKNTPPGEQPNDLQHGNGALWTGLWPNGTVLIRPYDIDYKGWLGMKSVWWRAGKGEGQLVVTGHRLDADAPEMESRMPADYGDIGIQATAIYFPSEGCWEVTGTAGTAELTFVTLVVKAP